MPGPNGGTRTPRSSQERLYQEMLGRIKETDLAVPYRDGGWWYYTRTEQGKAYPIFCRKRGSLEAPEEVYFDQNCAAEGKPFHALGGMDVSPDGRWLLVPGGHHRLPGVHPVREGPGDRRDRGPDPRGLERDAPGRTTTAPSST